MSEEQVAKKTPKAKTERELHEEREQSGAEVQRHAASFDGGEAIRLYQADDASDAPGAWYAVVTRDGFTDPDVRLAASIKPRCTSSRRNF